MLIDVLILIACIAGWFAMEMVAEAVIGALLRAVRRLVPVRTSYAGVVLWWLLSFLAGCAALGWWQENPTPARLVVTVLGFLCLAGSGLAMTASHVALEAERHAPLPSRFVVSPARAQRRW